MSSIYNNTLLEHLRSPQNCGAMDCATHRAAGSNSLCGDTCEIFIRLSGDILVDVSFVATGCAVVKSTASLMTTLVKGTTQDEALASADTFRKFLADTSGAPAVANWLEPFSALQGYPVRVRCALLAWNVLERALAQTEMSD